MSKGNIVIVEGISTGYNFIEDIIKRGYEPVVLETRFADPEAEKFFAAYRKRCYGMYPREVTIIPAGATYEDDLEAVRKYDPVLILAGEEHGVDRATRLADDLGLPGNPYSDIDKFTMKSAMHQALADNGVRSIRGKLVSSLEEAEEYVRSLGHENVVVKPTVGAGSQGLKLCSSMEEMCEGVERILGESNYFGDRNSVALVQERIFGKEYIVNTISRRGKHKVISIWTYERLQTAEGGSVYDHVESVNELGPGHTELIEYVYKTLDAIGIKDGPVHGEYMIDSSGPVLMEVNCRPMGLAMPAEYLDLVTGQHETDTILDAMLDEDNFMKHLHDPYRMLRKGIIKMFIAPKDVLVTAQPVQVLLRHMSSVYKTVIPEMNVFYLLKKSEDMEGNAGVVFMVHDDPDATIRDAAFLHKLENEYFRILYHGTGRKQTPLKADCMSIGEVMEMMECKGSTLIVSDDAAEPESAATYVRPEKLGEALSGFNQVILDLPEYGSGREVEESVESMFAAMGKVKAGGRLIVPERFYQKIPYGRSMIEALMQIGGFSVLAPSCDAHDVVCGRREV